MGIGPITIYDKSALQALSMDESVWLDAFFLVNVVPLFYVETLADLEKQVAAGRSPEDLVGMLATKTPPNAVPNVHHRSLVAAELTGSTVPMDGRVPLAGGDVMRTADGSVGLHYEQFEEAVALERWQTRDFLPIEREFARRWRSELADPERDRKIAILRNVLPRDERVSDLASLKAAVDGFCASSSRETLRLALDFLDVPSGSADAVVARWEASGRRPMDVFAPYSTHVFKVDLLFYLGIDRGFISGDRPSNRTDMAYLYYLPFCMVFTSGDNLHRRTAPLFLRGDQSFVDAPAFKSALRDLDDYYERLPDEIKALGVMAFAHYPPPKLDNPVTALWDKHMRADWRDLAEDPEQVLARWRDRQGRSGAATLTSRIRDAEPVDGETLTGEPDYVVLRREVPARKGKWRLLPEGSAAAGEE